MFQDHNKNKTVETNSTSFPIRGTTPSLALKKRRTCSSEGQHLSPQRVRTDALHPSSVNRAANAFRISSPGNVATHTRGLENETRCSDFATSSSRYSPYTADQPCESVESYIPHSTASTELRGSDMSHPPRSSSRQSELINTCDVTPFPVLRRDTLDEREHSTQSFNSESLIAQCTNVNDTYREEASFLPNGFLNLFSPYASKTVFSHQYSGPAVSYSASASTVASIRDSHLHGDIKAALSVPITSSTSDSRETIEQTPKAADVPQNRTQIHTKRSFYLGIFLLFLVVLFNASSFLTVLSEFSSRRCWIKEASDDSFQPKTIICSEDSRFRFVPYFIRPLLHVQVIDSKSSSLTGVDVGVARNAVRFLHQSVIGLLGIPKFLSAFQILFTHSLRFLIHQLDNRLHVGESTASTNESALMDGIWADIQQRITQFESTGFIEQELRESMASRRLREHSTEFRQRIEHVTDNVFVAIGYGLANVVIVQTNKGIILFDTLENPKNLNHVMKDWSTQRQRLNLNGFSMPLNLTTASSVIAIVYSHFHTDHVFGASAVYEKGVTQIWSHELTDQEISKVFTITAGTTYKRSMRQFGSLLSEEDGYINSGIGKFLTYNSSDPAIAIAPTHTWSGDRKIIEIGGEVLELIHAPGESRDQSIVWLPKKKLLFGADNIYKAFPNIYAIRGTESRNAMIWVKTLDVMRELKPDYLVLGHTGPLRGKELIYSTITAYRDGIQFVHDQTLRFMNKGYSVEDIVQIVNLPPHLRNHPYLQPYYGTVASTVRAVFHHYLGWYSGLPEDLNPLPRPEKAEKMAKLVGGRIQLLQKSIEALEKKEYQWALELVSHAQLLSPCCEVTQRIRADLLRLLASVTSSTPARNWYLTASRESEERTAFCMFNSHLNNVHPTTVDNGKVGFNFKKRTLPKDSNKTETGSLHADRPNIHNQLKVTSAQRNQVIKNMKSAVETFDAIPIRIKAEAGLNMESVVAFSFTDTHRFVCLHLRRGIAYVSPKCDNNPDIHVYTDDQTWRSILTFEIRPVVAVVTGRLRIKSFNPMDYRRLNKILSIVEIDME